MPRGRTRLRIFGVLLAVIGAVLATGGFQLVTLGGSWYYLLIGVGLVIAGVLFAMRHVTGPWLFAVLFVITIVWSLWEVGFDFWPQVPRMIGFIVLALLAALLYPFFVPVGRRDRAQRGAYAVSALLALALVGFFAFMFVPHGVIKAQSTPHTKTSRPSIFLSYPVGHDVRIAHVTTTHAIRKTDAPPTPI